MPREKSRYRDRDRRSSSYSSESSYERKKSKSKHKRRSRSRDRSEYSESSSHRKKRSNSKSRHKRKSYSRSVSRERYESKSKRRSASRSRSKRDRSKSSTRSRSKRDRSRSASSSRSRPKHKSKKSKKSRSSSSRSSSYEDRLNTKKYQYEDNKTEIEKAIKAAEAAGLTLQKIPTYEYKEVEVKEDMPTIHDRNLLAELNNDSFVPKSFTSSRNKKQNIVIDLNAQTVLVPEAEKKDEKDDSIINFDELPSEEELREMWIKKVYQFRKKIMKGEI